LSIYQKYKRNIFLLLKNCKIQSFEEIAASSIPFTKVDKQLFENAAWHKKNTDF